MDTGERGEEGGGRDRVRRWGREEYIENEGNKWGEFKKER